MISCPATIDGAKVLAYCTIDDRHEPTGATRHFAGGEPVEVPSGLAVCQYDVCDDVYLFYCDATWSSITDTCHSSYDDALRQAEFEFRGVLRFLKPKT